MACSYMRTFFWLTIFYALASAKLDAAKADKLHNYITRPDLQAPKWNISIYDRENLAPGYWFMSPYEHINQKSPGKGWIGPHIYDDEGELIWSGAELFGHMSAMDFKVSKFRDRTVLSMIRPEVREVVLLDDAFQIIEDVPIEGLNMHDLNFIDDGNHALVITRGVVNASEELSKVTGLETGNCEANFHGILELDTTTWEPIWNWTSYDHIGFDDTSFQYGPAPARCKHEWDFLHANAVDKCPDGDILFSARHTDTIYKISKLNGSIVWRLGGHKKKNDFEFDARNVNFSRQHDVRCRFQNATHTVITLMDNAKGEDPQRPTSAHSRGLQISLDTVDMTATLISHHDHPDLGYTDRRGSYQVLSNKNVFMGWSERSLHSEHAPHGRMLMQARMLPEWLGSYRSYKFPFVGRPLQAPDVLAHAFTTVENSTIMNVYVSWNGATEVGSWNLYRTDARGRAGATSLIARKVRSGFETEIAFDGYAKFVIVEALGKDGGVLENGRSRVFATLPAMDMLTAEVAAEELWLQQITEGVRHGRQRLDYQSTGIAFVGGFVLCKLLGLVAWWICRTMRRSSRSRTPWHLLAKGYRPLNEKEEEIGVEFRECESGCSSPS
ncbi:hypothetical protein AC578_10431 [Pseudocercospora eumusae]|uniref:ASST-domain-containing protein n=1 Tax=Pseudocercospora eumusae TaxID=321146 RepID=A0A139H2L4_9PEZI|nr:hypothetical protein AC578_10431 [Pseudocercospora eumusae]